MHKMSSILAYEQNNWIILLHRFVACALIQLYRCMVFKPAKGRMVMQHVY